MVFATVPEGDFVWTKGANTVKWLRTSEFGRRSFCAECGTPFLIKVNFQPATVDFAVGTLDEPGAVAPGFHIFWASKLPWFNPGDDLPRYDGFRPNTRGLDGTERPPSRSNR